MSRTLLTTASQEELATRWEAALALGLGSLTRGELRSLLAELPEGSETAELAGSVLSRLS